MTISVKVVVGLSMAFVVAVVAAVTLVITYTVSISAIHTSGRRLAGAMMDTVSAKVTNYNGIAEKAMHDVVNMTTIPGYMVPIDDPEPQWWVKWEIALRTHLMASDFQYSTVAIIYNDGGASATGPYWVNTSFYYGYTIDARTLTPNGTGLCTVVSHVYRVIATNRDCDPVYDNQTCYQPNEYSRGDNRIGGYYSVLALTNRKPVCFWVTPGVDTYRVRGGEFTMYGSCVMLNHTGALVGAINFGQRLDNIGAFLHGAATTPGTQIFLLDPALLLVASTHPTPFQNFYDPGTPGIKAGVNGCASSKDQSIEYPERIGCRSPASLFPYPPLQELASSEDGRAFLLTPTREERFGDVGDATYFYIGTHISSRNLIYTFNMVLFLPESDILGDIVTGMNVAIGVTVAVFVIAVVLTNVLLHVLLAPLGDVAERMYRVANLENTDSADGRTEQLNDDDDDDDYKLFADDQVDQAPGSRLDPSNMTEIRALQVAYETMDTAIKSFTRYVPKDVVKELVLTNQICEIAMRPLNCTMLFADIAGFTSICERIAPHVLSGLVKLYFERSSRIVMGHGGIIDKFIGDCIMAVWGAPIVSDRHELRGALCAKSLVFETEVDPLRGAFERVNESLAIRVGVATGVVLAGNMGSSARMNYTVIGDDVNLASRLESLNRYWGTSTMISAATALECQEWLLLRHVVTIAVVGKQQPVEVYEVVGARPDSNIKILGTMTAESEMQTLAEVKRDREREELNNVYVKSKTDGKLDRMSVGPLVQRLKRKVPIGPAHFRFVAACNEAMAHFGKGNFSACLAALRAITNDASIPDSLKQCQSLERIARACEDYMSHPPGGEFDGTWKADGK